MLYASTVLIASSASSLDGAAIRPTYRPDGKLWDQAWSTDGVCATPGPIPSLSPGPSQAPSTSVAPSESRKPSQRPSTSQAPSLKSASSSMSSPLIVRNLSHKENRGRSRSKIRRRSKIKRRRMGNIIQGRNAGMGLSVIKQSNREVDHKDSRKRKDKPLPSSSFPGHHDTGQPKECWRQCPDHVKNKNIILLDHYGAAGLNDRGWIFEQVVALAGYLCATVRVPPPRTMVSS